jgi:hypothetical protein
MLSSAHPHHLSSLPGLFARRSRIISVMQEPTRLAYCGLTRPPHPCQASTVAASALSTPLFPMVNERRCANETVVGQNNPAPKGKVRKLANLASGLVARIVTLAFVFTKPVVERLIHVPFPPSGPGPGLVPGHTVTFSESFLGATPYACCRDSVFSPLLSSSVFISLCFPSCLRLFTLSLAADSLSFDLGLTLLR